MQQGLGVVDQPKRSVDKEPEPSGRERKGTVSQRGSLSLLPKAQQAEGQGWTFSQTFLQQ